MASLRTSTDEVLRLDSVLDGYALLTLEFGGSGGFGGSSFAKYFPGGFEPLHICEYTLSYFWRGNLTLTDIRSTTVTPSLTDASAHAPPVHFPIFVMPCQRSELTNLIRERSSGGLSLRSAGF